MIDTETYRSKVELHCQGSPWHSRMLASERILLGSARKIANLQIDLLDHGTTSQPSSMTSIMLAIVIIGLNIVKNPTSTRNRSDLEVNNISKNSKKRLSLRSWSIHYRNMPKLNIPLLDSMPSLYKVRRPVHCISDGLRLTLLQLSKYFGLRLKHVSVLEEHLLDAVSQTTSFSRSHFP
jgi:hypothetical protein